MQTWSNSVSVQEGFPEEEIERRRRKETQRRTLGWGGCVLKSMLLANGQPCSCSMHLRVPCRESDCELENIEDKNSVWS